MAETLSGREGEIETRTILGQPAHVWQSPDEVFIEWRPTRPAYFHVAEGDVVKDADRDVESPLIKQWTVTDITPETVVAERVDDGEVDIREWDRAEFERKLVTQTYATNLTDFERVTVHQFGRWGLDAVEHAEHTYVGDPYVMVLAYGNNGEKYGRRYHFVSREDDENVTLWRQDLAVSKLPAALATKLDQRVTTALEAEGYRVQE
ncbi:hypothetical protein [Haloarchaeobius amylolyticus]|uniref:hypothetical protein n=1 Tax=Haloarchaeobius amylolyticus TaxID=1198296 RepID=UPI00226D4A0A|nr:hypothetical protein [Haloarchaeobius amylolyticus]